MQKLNLVVVLLTIMILTACGRSAEETNLENMGRTALTEMLGFELVLPNDAQVFVEGDRAAELRFSNTLTEDAVNSIIPQFEAAGYTPQLRRDRFTLPGHTLAYTRVRGEAFKEVRGVEDRVGRETRMQMFKDFAVPTPTAKGKIARADQKMAFAFRRENRELRMENPMRNNHGLELVLRANPLRALLTEARVHTLGVRQDQRLRSATPHEAIQNDGFEEREADRVCREDDAPPRMCLDQVERREAHTARPARRRTSCCGPKRPPPEARMATLGQWFNSSCGGSEFMRVK